MYLYVNVCTVRLQPCACSDFAVLLTRYINTFYVCVYICMYVISKIVIRQSKSNSHQAPLSSAKQNVFSNRQNSKVQHQGNKEVGCSRNARFEPLI